MHHRGGWAQVPNRRDLDVYSSKERKFGSVGGVSRDGTTPNFKGDQSPFADQTRKFEQVGKGKKVPNHGQASLGNGWKGNGQD